MIAIFPHAPTLGYVILPCAHAGGDGRLLVMAARVGASAIGVDVNPHCIRASRRRAAKAGLEASIDICEFDLTKVRSHPRFEEVTMLYLYLMPKPIAAAERLLGFKPSRGCDLMVKLLLLWRELLKV